jgi:predicted ATP-binding protein involved in virulence
MIHQFKALGTNANLDFEIDLVPDKQVYCFIGENGCGKTNLLENMARGIVYNSLSKISEDVFSDKFYNFFHYHEQGGYLRKIELPNNIKFNGIQENITFDCPLVFIGARSRGHIDNTSGNNKQRNGVNTFSDFFHHFFSVIRGEKDDNSTTLADWIFERLIVNNAFIDDESKRDHEVRLILELLGELEPSQFSELSKKDLTEVFKYNNAQLSINGIPIDKLSTGYVSIIKIFQEIIAGYGAWLGLLGEKDIRNADGIVFIDEIESHLHAKWQFEIIPLLKRFFPKTTFYISTHSPLIISTTAEDEAYELLREGNEVKSKKLGNPQNWYFNSLLMQAFHVPLERKADNLNGNGIALSEKLTTFSNKVKAYKNSKEPALKSEVQSLYNELLPNFSDNDPRLVTLNALKSLVA